MVDFAAKVAVDTSALTELGELAHWSNLQVPNSKVAVSKIKGTLKDDPDIGYKFVGNNLTLLGSEPTVGTLKKIIVSDSENVQYKLTDLSIFFIKPNIQNKFDGNFEKSIFKGSDDIDGSAEVDALYGFNGNDKINGESGGDLIFGQRNNDKLNGNTGNDDINGGKGKDKLNGNAGLDDLTGGGGKDNFIFNSSLNGLTNVDTITDFTIGKDKIKLNEDVFDDIGGKGPLASDKFVDFSTPDPPDDVIVYDDATGDIYYNDEDSGMTLFARVSAGTDLSASDFLVYG